VAYKYARKKQMSLDINKGLSSILERLGEFFHIFDLSFVVAGAMTFSALTFLYIKISLPFWFPFQEWERVFVIIVGCYVCGLISFAGGRHINEYKRRRCLRKILPISLNEYNLCKVFIEHDDKQKIDKMYEHIYTLMWSKIVNEKPDSPALRHLMRYWSMSATYDGVAFSLIVWALVIFVVQFCQITPNPINNWVSIFGTLLTGMAALIAFRQAASYYEYQIKDLVAYLSIIYYGSTFEKKLKIKYILVLHK